MGNTSSLAERAFKVPRGSMENVLVQVDKFYNPIDFVDLDIEPIKIEINANQ